MAEHGAWGRGGAGRVGPPTPDQFPGLARLLGTSEDQIAAMVVADFYKVDTGNEFSARVRRLAPKLENLAEDDADMVEELVARLSR